MTDQEDMSKEESDYHFERLVAEGALRALELKAQLAQAEERYAEASLELTEIAYLIGGHGTTISQAKWLMGEYRRLKKENEELKRLVAPF